MISVVLPTYNGEKYIAQAIESILIQSYREFELIIVDDCSTDHTPAIIEEYARRDDRIRILHNTENLKLPKSLNRGFSVAVGKYFTWTSDDNILLESMLESLLSVLEEKKEIDFVYADSTAIDERGRNILSGRKLTGEISDLYVYNPINACFLYRRAVHDRLHGYNTKTFLYEDYNFWVRAYEAGFHFYHLKQTMYHYRYHRNSLTSTKNSKEALEMFVLRYWRNLHKIGYQDVGLRSKIWKKLAEVYMQQEDMPRYCLARAAAGINLATNRVQNMMECGKKDRKE